MSRESGGPRSGITLPWVVAQGLTVGSSVRQVVTKDERAIGHLDTTARFVCIERLSALGVGNWLGDSIALGLPVGRHAVVLYADDVHRARGVAARWVEVTPPVTQ